MLVSARAAESVQKWTWPSGATRRKAARSADARRIIREETRKSKDGRIGVKDFLDHASSSTRYGLFSPMEVNIIFHFAGRGDGRQRLALPDFAALLDPHWQAPDEGVSIEKVSSGRGFLDQLAQSSYNFAIGGFAGAFGATVVYPIDLGASCAAPRVSTPTCALFSPATLLLQSRHGEGQAVARS